MSKATGAAVHKDVMEGFSKPVQKGVVDLADKLYQLAKKQPSFEELCDKMNLAPSKVRALIDQAQTAGRPIHVAHDNVGISLPKPREDIQETGIAPVVGERQRVAVISDTHYGSKYCLRGAIKDFVNYAYAKGVREILHPGDMVDGGYKHAQFEMTHMGLSRQVEDMRKNLPCLPGLTYHAITGNHDWTFTEESGVNVGQYISDTFKAHGRYDFKCYGDRGAFIKLRGVLFELWHPRGGGAYAVSYNIQKKIEAMSSGMKPGVLLVGHYHRFCYVVERGVHALLCQTFQGGQSAFSKSLKCGAPSIGGTLLEFDLTADGTIRDFSVEKRTYFERETIHRVEALDSGIEV